MKIAINSEVLAKDSITMQQFAVLLYYLADGTGVLNEEICKYLWYRGFLEKKDGEEGYFINANLLYQIQGWIASSWASPESVDRFTRLANQMREKFPTGRKEGTNYYWRDSEKVISQRLSIFFKKYGSNYTDEQILEATDRYIESFNGNYSYMQLLKYFIYKRLDSGEEVSQLQSFLENAGQDEVGDWRDSVR